MSEQCTTFNASPDGVLTADVGVISGELELRSTRAGDGTVTLAIRYAGAEEWYLLPGGDYHLHDARDLDTLHRALVAVLTRPVAR